MWISHCRAKGRFLSRSSRLSRLRAASLDKLWPVAQIWFSSLWAINEIFSFTETWKTVKLSINQVIFCLATTHSFTWNADRHLGHKILSNFFLKTPETGKFWETISHRLNFTVKLILQTFYNLAGFLKDQKALFFHTIWERNNRSKQVLHRLILYSIWCIL